MASSPSNCWHAPAYFAISVILAFMAISATLHSSFVHSPPIKHVSDELALNISGALRRSGFNITATLLHVSPELFFSSPNATIFAIKDAAISNLTLPPWLMHSLFEYHTLSSSLSMDDLLNQTQGRCFPTFYKKKNIAITRADSHLRLVEINQVPVSHPDIFLGETISVHGVLGPFSPLNLEFIQSPICDSGAGLASYKPKSKSSDEGFRIVRLLSSNGFVSLAVGLQFALPGILEDHLDLSSVTIFAPPILPSIASPSPFLERIVRLHILQKKFTYKELASFPAKSAMKTLLANQDLEITNEAGSVHGLLINGVKIVAPEMMSSHKFVVHGISMSFQLSDTSKAAR